MRILVVLLLFGAAACAQVKLSPKDESDIRALMDDLAKKDNSPPADRMWNERGPRVYVIQKIEPLAENVAIVDAVGAQTGTFPNTRDYVFILKRTHGAWTIYRKIAVSPLVWLAPI